MRGVVLAGGSGTRLGALTRVVNKHLLPVGPYPMIYHAVKKLAGAGITDILLVSGPDHLGDFIRLFGSGRDHNCNLTYRAQDRPGGIAQALGLAEAFCAGAPLACVLGDNIYQNPLDHGLLLKNAALGLATILLKSVPDPRGYGVAELAGDRVVGIEEKPAQPKSNLAVVGVYAYPPDVFGFIRTLKPSQRGELEITDVNRHYLTEGKLTYHLMDGYWTDAGTPESLAEANRLVTQEPPNF